MNLKNNYIVRNNERYSKAQVMMNYHFLLQACCHMDCTEDLDQRCYYLTVHQKWNLREDISKIAYLKLNNLITRKSSQRGKHRIGLIWEEDRAGTRYGNTSGYGKHYHALVILPVKPRVDVSSPDLVSELIKERIGQINEAGEIHCTPYRPDRPISEVLD